MVVGAVVLFAIVGLFPVGNFLVCGLENRFPKWDASRGVPDGVIVLGNAISPELSSAVGEPVFSGNGSRMLAMAKLACDYPSARIVYSGGDGSLSGNGIREADFICPTLDSLGIARERVQLETRSRNTAENASFMKVLVNLRPGEHWLVVTSARHMPRAIGCFRKAGFRVEAYPAGWQSVHALNGRWGRRLAYGLDRLDAAA